MSTYIPTYLHACLLAYFLTYTHVCMCVCIHIHICTYTHIRISHAYPRLTTLDLNVLWAYPCGLQNCVLKFETFQGHGSQDLAGFCGVHIGKNSTYWRSNKRCIDCHHSTRTGIARRLSKHNQRQNVLPVHCNVPNLVANSPCSFYALRRRQCLFGFTGGLFEVLLALARRCLKSLA